MAMTEMEKAIARSYEAARQRRFYENQAKAQNNPVYEKIKTTDYGNKPEPKSSGMFSDAMTEAERQKAFYENQARQEKIVDSLYVTPSGSDKERARKEAQLKEELTPAQLEQMIDKVATQKQREVKRQEALSLEQKESERLQGVIAEGKKQAPTYRTSYEVGELTSFEEAKQASDETYRQYWYDKANDVTKNWTDADYALLVEPKYKTVKTDRRGNTKDVRVYPEGYDKYKEAQERINAGPLDFSSEETHKMLIKPPQSKHGYGKYQSWISKDDPLRQAVEAQADVMKDFLDAEGISISKSFGDGNPDNVYGEGVYLNTGTSAHIDWDSDLKRMQRYMTAPDSELGTYSQVFYRPETESILDNVMVNVIAAVTGTSAYLTAARGGDLEDVAKTYVAGEITAPILEEVVGTFGVDADLFGMDAKDFSEGMMDVQETLIKGGDVEDALIKEFGVPVLKKAAGAIGDMLPEGGFETPQILKDAEDVIKVAGRAFDDAVLQKAKPIVEAVGDVGQEVIDITAETFEPVVDLVDEGLDVFGEKVVDPVLQVGSDVLSEVEDIAKEGGRQLDKKVLQPVYKTIDPIVQAGSDVLSEVEDIFIDPIKEVAPVVEDVVKEGGRKFDEAVLQPIKENVLEPVVDVGQKVIDVVQEGGRKFDEAVLQPAKDFVEDIELPEAPDLPDLPDMSMPDLPFSIGGLLDSGTPQQRTPVENLFDKELFKFDTEIKSTQQMLSPIMNLRRYG